MDREAAGAVPDDVIEEVAERLWTGESSPFIGWADLTEQVKEMQRTSARAVLSVPSVAEVFARDAKVRELDALADAGATQISLWRWESGDGWCAEYDSHPSVIAEGATPSEALADLTRLAALCSEDGTR